MSNRFLNWFLIIVTTAAILFASYQLLLHIIFVLQGAYSPTAPVFWTVGRGMLNDLIPYIDLFERKAPGIFVLSALSLFMSGNGFIGQLVHVALVIAVIASLMFVMHACTHEREKRVHRLWMMAAFLYGAVWILYLSAGAGAWRPTFYGVGFAALYLLLISYHLHCTPFGIGLASVLLFAGIGFREQLFLPILAGALVLLHTPRQFAWGFIFPLGIAFMLGLVSLALFGMLDGYAHIYLLDIFGHYTQRFGIPFWQMGLALDPVLRHLSNFSYVYTGILVVLFGLQTWNAGNTYRQHASVYWSSFALMGSLFLLLSVTRSDFTLITSRIILLVMLGALLYLIMRKQNTDQRLVTAQSRDGLHLIVSIVFLLTAGLLVTLHHHYSFIVDYAHVVPIVKTLCAVYLVALLFQWNTEQRRLMYQILVLLGALFLTLTAVSLAGDFQPDHFYSAAPLYMALFIASVRVSHRAWVPTLLIVFLVATLASMPKTFASPLHSRQVLRDQKQLEQTMQAAAASVDAILDGCNLEHYFFINPPHAFFGFTKHSPRTFFPWIPMKMIPLQHPVMAQKTLEGLSQSQVVVIGDGYNPTSNFEVEMMKYVRKSFSSRTPDCAKRLSVPKDQQVFYRI